MTPQLVPGRLIAAPLLALTVVAAPAPAAAQTMIMRYSRQMSSPVNHGLPDLPGGFTLCRLRYERISATHLFPGYDGVVEGIRERALWDEVTFPWEY